ncbi:MAG: hypothetical protein NTV97_25920 [Alphaproteobacteria bacterium]|nr:hypothetical protein [Alphaproteobacteria bacterium]
MFKSILATASAALIAFTIAQPASAGWTNGVSLNGGGENGTLLNGGGANGTSTATSKFAIDGIELPATTR